MHCRCEELAGERSNRGAELTSRSRRDGFAALAMRAPCKAIKRGQHVRHDRRIHPGSGRRRGRDHPKGRQVDPAALAEVQALLGERERRRDLLIEHLHLLQDHYGCLHARHLAALAEEMRLALVEVYEVASFYAHFDIVMDDETPPPPLTVRVCDSLSCELAGAPAASRRSADRLGDGVRVVRAPCMGGCHRARWSRSAMPCTSTQRPTSSPPRLPPARPIRLSRPIPGLDAYRADGGYRLLQPASPASAPASR